MFVSSFFLLPFALLQTPKDAKAIDLGDGYQRIETAAYSVEIPKGWDISLETPWGARKATPGAGSGELGVMTAPPTRQSWDELYRTSLYYIMREEKGKATPYRLGKTKAGLETASFEVADSAGFPARRFVLIRSQSDRLLALSVKVPSAEKEADWARHFERLVNSARFRE